MLEDYYTTAGRYLPPYHIVMDEVPDRPNDTSVASPSKTHRTGLVKVKRFNEATLRRGSTSISPPPKLANVMGRLRTSNQTVREFIAELIGTFILILIGCGVGACLLFNGASPSTFMAINSLGWGWAILVAIFFCGGVSGAHLNPAVTVGFASIGKLPWRKTLHYMAAQYIGALLASAVVLGIFSDAISNFDGGKRAILPHANATAQIFACYPQPHVSVVTCLFDQIVSTALLMIGVCAITDEHNMQVPKGLQPLAIALTLVSLITGFGYNCGAPLNPARDLSPRILTAMAGWGAGVFSHHSYWFWVPVVGPHIGAVLGGWLYKISVEINWNQEEQTYDFWKNGSIGSLSTDIASGRVKGETNVSVVTDSTTEIFKKT